jgi:hypothetical protein
MSVDLFLKIYAVYLGLFSLVWAANPAAGLEENPDEKSLFVARLLGTNGIMIGVLAWLLSSQSHTIIREFLWVGIVVNLVPIILIVVNLIRGKFGKREYIGIASHALPLAGFAYYLTSLMA